MIIKVDALINSDVCLSFDLSKAHPGFISDLLVKIIVHNHSASQTCIKPIPQKKVSISSVKLYLVCVSMLIVNINNFILKVNRAFPLFPL